MTTVQISRDEVERARLMSEFKYEIDTQSKIGYARKEGRKEGREEGREEGQKEIARNLKAMGDPVNKIARVTGLTEEQIREL